MRSDLSETDFSSGLSSYSGLANRFPGGGVNAAAPVGDPKLGKELFTTTCAICHGVDAQGLPGLGKNLVSSEFVGSQSDRDLVEFIKVGRAPDDPLNTTGVRMPPRGNNPALTDED